MANYSKTVFLMQDGYDLCSILELATTVTATRRDGQGVTVGNWNSHVTSAQISFIKANHKAYPNFESE